MQRIVFPDSLPGEVDAEDRLPGARLAGDRDQEALRYAPSEDVVELPDPGGEPPHALPARVRLLFFKVIYQAPP